MKKKKQKRNNKKTKKVSKKKRKKKNDDKKVWKKLHEFALKQLKKYMEIVKKNEKNLSYIR